MIKVFGTPNLVVNTFEKFGRHRKQVHLFNFDENGEFLLNPEEFAPAHVLRVKNSFKWEDTKVESPSEVVEITEEYIRSLSKPALKALL
jgi:hypothetical protein